MVANWVMYDTDDMMNERMSVIGQSEKSELLLCNEYQVHVL